MLDFLPLEEAQPAVHAIRQSGRNQRMFQHPRLRVGTIQQRHFGEINAFALELLNLFDDKLGFVHIGRRFVHTQLFAAAFCRPQILAETVAVVADQRVGSVEDVAVRAVVLLQFDNVFHMKIAQQFLHVADVRTAKGIDGLVVVAHCKQCVILSCQQL